jgi:hypothetical protein
MVRSQITRRLEISEELQQLVTEIEAATHEILRSFVVDYDTAGAPYGRSFPDFCRWLADSEIAPSIEAARDLRFKFEEAGLVNASDRLTYVLH